MAVIPAGFAQVNYVLPTNTWAHVPQITLGIDFGGFVGDGEVMANTLYQIFEDEILPELTTNTRLAEVRVKAGPNELGPTWIATGSATGLSGEETEPPAIAMLVSKQSALGGRKHRGRFYVPGIADANVLADGTIEQAALTAYNAAFASFLAAMYAVELNPVILHGEADSDLVPTPISSLRVKPVVGIQRRRNRG